MVYMGFIHRLAVCAFHRHYNAACGSEFWLGGPALLLMLSARFLLLSFDTLGSGALGILGWRHIYSTLVPPLAS